LTLLLTPIRLRSLALVGGLAAIGLTAAAAPRQQPRPSQQLPQLVVYKTPT
jgi:hypothetical protein